MALVAPTALPAVLLVLAVPLNAFVWWRDRRWIDAQGLGWVLVGRVVGTVVGVWVLLLFPVRLLSVFFGILILVAVVLSTALPDAFGSSGGWRFVAGLASGVMAAGGRRWPAPRAPLPQPSRS